LSILRVWLSRFEHVTRGIGKRYLCISARKRRLRRTDDEWLFPQPSVPVDSAIPIRRAGT
jgi:hypothetical protein